MGRLGGFEMLAQEAADNAYRAVMMMRDNPFGDSPIEHLFFAALVTAAREEQHNLTDVAPFRPEYPLSEAKLGAKIMGRGDRTVFIEKQVEIAGWRVDFVLHYPLFDQPAGPDGWPALGRLIVECDGHAFHERTKEQAARDRSRDRVAQYHGLPIFRFTGSELWNDAMGCAHEVLSFMERG